MESNRNRRQFPTSWDDFTQILVLWLKRKIGNLKKLLRNWGSVFKYYFLVPLSTIVWDNLAHLFAYLPWIYFWISCVQF